MQPNSTLGTFVVATVLCVVCSLIVSGSAVLLKEKQDENKRLDRKKNVLLAAQLCDTDADARTINSVYEEQIRELLIDMESGQPVSDEQAPQNYDADKAAKDPAYQVAIEPADALMGVRHRAPMLPVYEIVDGQTTTGYIFPVEGKGLWSTLKGFLALDADGQTVRGITFYSHAETPGLGGEVDNPKWKASWKGKQVYSESGDVALDVVKGVAATDYQIDGLSGATITSNGVDGIVSYWLGENGFGPFLKKRKGPGAQAATPPSGSQVPASVVAYVSKPR